MFQRIGGRTVPVAVEIQGNSVDGRAGYQYIQVGEGDSLRGAEILVTDIAPADDGGLAIDGEGFVVHAPVQPAKIGKEAQRLENTEGEGVEQPHFDVGLGVQQCELAVQAIRAVVVEQQPYAYLALCGVVECS